MNIDTETLYAINDAITSLAADFGMRISDESMDEIVPIIARALVSGIPISYGD